MGVRIQVTSTNNIDGAIEDIRAGIVRGETKAAERLLALSVDKAPAENLHLIGSGQVEPATDPEEGAAVIFDTPYAAKLHENPQFNFSTKVNPNAQGKYVEDPAVEHRKELGDIIRQEARRGA